MFNLTTPFQDFKITSYYTSAGGLHPGGNLDGTFVAAMHKGFVLGPEGELCK